MTTEDTTETDDSEDSDNAGHVEEWRSLASAKPSERDETIDTEDEDTPDSEWKTASGEALPQREDHRSHPQSRNWSFGVIRIIRVLVGVVAFFALLFNIDGALARIAQNPGLAALTVAAISQFIHVEDVQRVRSLLGR